MELLEKDLMKENAWIIHAGHHTKTHQRVTGDITIAPRTLSEEPNPPSYKIEGPEYPAQSLFPYGFTYSPARNNAL